MLIRQIHLLSLNFLENILISLPRFTIKNLINDTNSNKIQTYKNIDALILTVPNNVLKSFDTFNNITFKNTTQMNIFKKYPNANNPDTSNTSI